MYTLDPAGNRSTKQDDLAGVTSNYTYDKIYELTQVTQGSSTTESYSYDPVGNRTASLAIPSYTVNTSNELTGTSSASYTYDNNGNTTSKTVSGGTTDYSWDYENRLSSVTLPSSGGTVTFKYDPFGRRIEKISPTTTSIFAYDEGNLVETVNSSGSVVARYVQGQNLDQPLAMRRGTTTSYYEQDGLDSITSLSNTSGALAQTYTYDSFGNTTNSTGSLTNFFRYAGREFDTETGLYYMRARYFDPQTGRFLSEDPIEFRGGINFYAYVDNNAVNQTDPDGTGVVDCAKALADLQASTARLAGRLAASAAHGGPDAGHKKAIQQAANQVKDDLAKVTKHCGCYVALAAEIALAIEAAEAALAAAAAAAGAAATA